LPEKGVDVSWSLKGSYFETCSCDLMCPCNFSFDHGATYDYCRVTLVFNVAEGDVEETDVSGRTVAVTREARPGPSPQCSDRRFDRLRG